MQNSCLLSVIVPVYNAQEYVGRCLQALAVQTCISMEIIVINDGSTDESGQICDRYAAQYPGRIFMYHQKNQGVFRARATGIALAKGEYIGFCDSDDIPKPEMYQKMLECALQQKAEMAICAFERVDMHTGKILATEMTRFGDAVLQNNDPGFWSVVNTALWNKIIRKELLQHAVDFKTPPRVLEDMMLLCSLYPYVQKVVFLQTPLYCYMVHAGSAMMTVKSTEVALLEKCMKHTREVVASSEKGPKWLELCDSMAFIHFGVSVAMRLAQQPDMNPYRSVRRIRAMLNSSFPFWNKNRFFTWHYSINHFRWLHKPMLALTCYRLYLMPLAIQTYKMTTSLLKIDIKW